MSNNQSRPFHPAQEPQQPAWTAWDGPQTVQDDDTSLQMNEPQPLDYNSTPGLFQRRDSAPNQQTTNSRHQPNHFNQTSGYQMPNLTNHRIARPNRFSNGLINQSRSSGNVGHNDLSSNTAYRQFSGHNNRFPWRLSNSSWGGQAQWPRYVQTSHGRIHSNHRRTDQHLQNRHPENRSEEQNHSNNVHFISKRCDDVFLYHNTPPTLNRSLPLASTSDDHPANNTVPPPSTSFVVHSPSRRNEIQPPPPDECANTTNSYAELDGEDDGGRKQSELARTGFQKITKPTVISIIDDPKPSSSNAEELPTINSSNENTDVAEAFSEASQAITTRKDESGSLALPPKKKEKVKGVSAKKGKDTAERRAVKCKESRKLLRAPGNTTHSNSIGTVEQMSAEIEAKTKEVGVRRSQRNKPSNLDDAVERNPAEIEEKGREDVVMKAPGKKLYAQTGIRKSPRTKKVSTPIYTVEQDLGESETQGMDDGLIRSPRNSPSASADTVARRSTRKTRSLEFIGNDKQAEDDIRKSARKKSSESAGSSQKRFEDSEAQATEKRLMEQKLPEHQTSKRPIIAPSSVSKNPVKKRRLHVIITLRYSKIKPDEIQEEDEEDDKSESSSEESESEESQSNESSRAVTEAFDVTPWVNMLFTIDGVQYWPQMLPCNDITFGRSLPKCRPCTVKTNDQCLFQNIRALPLNRDGKVSYCLWNRCIFRPMQLSLERPLLPTQADLNWPMDPATRMYMQYVCAKSLLPIFEEALQHSLADQIIIRPREIQFRHYCDFCSTGLFLSSYLCRKCGQEYCTACHQKMLDQQDNLASHQLNGIYRCASDVMDTERYLHDAGDMLPVTSFSSEELESETKAMLETVEVLHSNKINQVPANVRGNSAMEQAMDSDLSDLSDTSDGGLLPTINETISDPQTGTSEVYSEDCRVQKLLQSHAITRFEIDSMNEKQFLKIWCEGVPLVVGGVTPRLTWDANAFQERYGEMMCTVVRSDEDGTGEMEGKDPTDYCKRLTVHQFFETFSMDADQRRESLGKGNWKLKVRADRLRR